MRSQVHYGLSDPNWLFDDMNFQENIHIRSPHLRVLLDISYTISSSKTSGIERVVRNICSNWSDLLSKSEVELIHVVSYTGKFYQVTKQLEVAFSRQSGFNRNVFAMLPKTYQIVARALHRLLPMTCIQRWFLPEPGHLGIFKPFAELNERRIRRGIGKLPFISDISKQDLILMPDAYWTEMQALDAAQEARLKGATVVVLIYDLIPLTHPETVGVKRSRDFFEYFKKACMSADALVAISKTVQEEVRDAIPRMLLRGSIVKEHSLCFDVHSFRLGADLPITSQSTLSSKHLTARQSEVNSRIIEAFSSECSSEKPYLMVSAFDPRKNHQYVLDVFDLLWKQDPKIRLCLIGRKGSLCDEVLYRIANHPRLNQSLFVFHQASDIDLAYCYKHAAAALMPSIAEGFGLPIVESLHMGCVTMASDIPVHREVGQSSCEYFDIDAPESLAEMIVKHRTAAIAGTLTARPVYLPTTWRQSAEELFGLCLMIYRQNRHEKNLKAQAA